MLHVVKPNDTLLGIAQQYRITISSILSSNVICNPNFIYIGQPLIIPEESSLLPKAGGYPYYVVTHGDTLGCLAKQFGKSIESLAKVNKLKDSPQIYPGMELLVSYDEWNPKSLFDEWNSIDFTNMTERTYLAYVNQFEIQTFVWESMGHKAVSYLTQLLNHQNDFIRRYATLSLGRIGTGHDTFTALHKALKNDSFIAQLALKRYQLIPRWTKRIHIVSSENKLLLSPNLSAPSKTISAGTPVVVLRWQIPSPTNEVNDFVYAVRLQIYDFIQVVETGETGYLPRDFIQHITML